MKVRKRYLKKLDEIKKGKFVNVNNFKKRYLKKG